MSERDPLIYSYTHLNEFRREQEALLTLKKIASLVKPIMRARGWRVRELAEFYPSQQSLLGLNVNRGQKILLRLRYPGDRDQFLPFEQVTDTMLHELSHIVRGPHDDIFHALWDQLRDELEGLIRKGYTGEGFLSEGRPLGGARVPMHEARRLARVAAETRKGPAAGSSRKLGGAAARPGEDIRRVIADAVERRNMPLQGCGNTRHNEREIQDISDTATRHGFKTQAEEDAANDAAIAQALWELVREDEKAKYGSAYVPPSAQRPEGSMGRASARSNRELSPKEPRSAGTPWPQQAPRMMPRARSQQPATGLPAESSGWTCGICTLHNSPNYLCCDACGTERPESTTWKLAEQQEKKRLQSGRPAGMATTSRTNSRTQQPAANPGPATWQCSFCGNNMDRMWWTCSTCGKMKDSSR